MRISPKIAAWPVALMLVALRWTCRLRLHNDPRPQLREAGTPYAYAVLHAHQVAASICREKGTAAMVSRSRDGDLIAVGLKMMGVKPIRGSSRRDGRDKGGRDALQDLIAHVAGGQPAYVAVDGPRGPRNKVHKGIAVLAKESGAAIICVAAIPTRRWIFARAWDRTQIPKFFSRVDAYFADPIHPVEGETTKQLQQRIESVLNELEARWDPGEVPQRAEES